jgi:hypothetical protein
MKVVGGSWKEISTRLMNGCWKNSYPNGVHSSEWFGVSPVCPKIAISAKQPGFQDVGEDDIAKLF